MTEYVLSAATRDKLKKIATPTIATALFKRGLRNQFIQDVHPLSQKPENMVGQAFTLRYIPAREDLNTIEVSRIPNIPNARRSSGVLLVLCSSWTAERCACRLGWFDPDFALAGSRVEGVVTDGGFRDSPEIAQLDMHAYHQRPSAPTNLTLHQAWDMDIPIGCGDVAVFPGDVIVGDNEGVIVIPAELADEIADEAHEMTAYEDFVTEKVMGGATIIGLYPATSEQPRIEFAEWRKKNNR